MPDDNLKTSVLSSLFWTFLESGGVMVVSFIVQIILARLLLPEDYGIIALITFFILIAGVFIQSGLGTSLIQKKEATDEDFSSVFYLTLGIALVIYCILFLASPLIAAFYGQPIISPVLRVLGFILFFGALNSVQYAFIARNFRFKEYTISTLGAVLLSGVPAIALAYAGYGVWALVGQQLTYIIALCIIMWFTVKWRPKLLFSFARVKVLFSFGWKLLISQLANVAYNNVSFVIIGKLYPPSMLGYYTKGQEFPRVIMASVDSSIQAVMLPAYSKNQDNRPLVKQIMRRALVTSSFLVFPLMVGLAVVAEPLVVLLLTDKWLMCVPFLQIFCAFYALWPINTANLQAIIALGRSDIFLKLEIVKIVIGISVLAFSISFGIYAIALGMVVTGIISTFINSYPNKKLLDYGFAKQWKDLKLYLIMSLMMGGLVYSIIFLGLSVWVTLVLQITVGAIMYMGLAWLLKLESFTYVMDVAKEYITRGKRSF